MTGNRRLTLRVAGAVVLAAGAAAVLGAHRDVLRAGLGTLARSCPTWVLAAVALECATVVAYALLQRRLLRAGGATIRMRSVLCTVVHADAIATSVPMAGSSLAMAFAYRDFRRDGADRLTASTVPLLSAAISAVTFVALLALGTAVSGSPVTAGIGLLAAVLLGGALVAAWSATTPGRLHAGLATVADRAGRLVPRAPVDLGERLTRFLDRWASHRVDRGVLGFSVLCASARWSADALCLAAAIEATGGSVPWSRLLLIWAAGAATSTLGLTPGGLGAADAVLVSGLIGAGVPVAIAGAAAVIYRLIVLKPVPRLLWFGYRRCRRPLARR